MRRLFTLACLLVGLAVLGSRLTPLPSASAGEADDLAEIQTLRARGGLAATQRLCHLVRKGSDEARVAALKALVAAGLRSHEIGDTLREAVDDRTSIEQQAAAVEALGHLGSSEDVTLLIDGLKVRDDGLRGVAHAALRTLTGHGARQDFGAWHRWWRKEVRKKPAAVRHAIHRLRDAEGQEREQLRKLLARDGWTDAGFLEDAVEEWLSDGDRELRATAFHVVSRLRLGDVSSAVASAVPHLTGLDGEDGLRAVRTLGLSPDLLAPYWRRRLESGR